MDRHHRTLICFLITLLVVSILASSSDDEQCVYTGYVKTGSVFKAGTDSKIGLTLADGTGKSMTVENIEKDWGLMDPDHDYYERGNLDIFSGRGPCLSPPLCRLNVTSDGSGSHHGWYCDYVEVTATGPNVQCSQSMFYVKQWIATDAWPYQLYADIDGCEKATGVERKGKLVVGNGAINDM